MNSSVQAYPPRIRYLDPGFVRRYSDFARILHFLSSDQSSLDAALLPEALEGLSLLVTRDPSLDVWLEMQNAMLTEPVPALVQSFFAQVVSWPTSIVTIESSTPDSLPLSGIDGELRMHFDEEGNLRLKPTATADTIAVPVTVFTEHLGEQHAFDAVMHFPRDYDDNDILGELSAICGIRVRLLSFVVSEDQSGTDAEPQSEALRVLAVIEEGSLQQRKYITYEDMATIAARAKLGLDDSSLLISEEAALTRSRVASKIAIATDSSTLAGVLIEELGPVPVGLSETIPEPDEALQNSSHDLCAFLVATLHCLHYACLLRTSSLEGINVSLTLVLGQQIASSKVGTDIVLSLDDVWVCHDVATAGQGHHGDTLRILLYSLSPEVSLGTRARHILKHQVNRRDLATMTGVRYGNLLSSLAVVSVGPLPSYLDPYWLRRLAATIELDDRRGRIAGVPDPWPYHVRKICQAVVSNPNIRSVLFIGNTSLCKDTLALLQSPDRAALRDLPAKTKVLYDRYVDQVEWTGTDLDLPSSLRLPHGFTRLVIASLRDKQQGIEGIGDRDAVTEPMSVVLTPGPLAINLGPIAEHFVAVEDLRDAQRAILHALVQHGRRTSPDELGYNYIELANYVVEVAHPLAYRHVSGVSIEDLERHYQSEWLSPDGRHGNRLLHQFGWNQIDDLAQQLGRLIIAGAASRRLVIYVGDPYRDRGSPLGLMVIHFTLRWEEERPLLDATYVWRSFEGFFGPAYSWYGACRLLEDLVISASQHLQSDCGPLRVGKFVCIMLNLHLFDDDLSQALIAEILSSPEEKPVEGA